MRPPMRQETPVTEDEWTPMVRRAAVTMEETRVGDGVGLMATTQVPLGPLNILGMRGGQTVHCFHSVPLHLVRGRVSARSMKCLSWNGMSSAGSVETQSAPDDLSSPGCSRT